MCHALFSPLLVLPSSGAVFEEGAAAHRTQGVGITATERGADALGVQHICCDCLGIQISGIH